MSNRNHFTCWVLAVNCTTVHNIVMKLQDKKQPKCLYDEIQTNASTAVMYLSGVIGDPCDVNTDCSDVIEFSECVEVNCSAICQCDEEHIPANNGTFCDIRKHHAFFAILIYNK